MSDSPCTLIEPCPCAKARDAADEFRRKLHSAIVTGMIQDVAVPKIVCCKCGGLGVALTAEGLRVKQAILLESELLVERIQRIEDILLDLNAELCNKHKLYEPIPY